MKQFMTIFLSILFILGSLSCTSYASPLSPVITAPSAILMDADTGDILYQKNPHDLMYPASTTKIMTAILTLEHTNLNDNVTIDKDTSFTGGSRLYLAEDEVLTVEQLLYAMMVESANDAAVALAKHISGSVEDFSNLMNERAKQLGAKNTHFVNPNGLPDDNHITTAYDLAVISKYAMTLPKFQEIVQTPYYEISPTNKQSELRYLTNSNRFLWGTGSRRNQIYYKDKWVNIKYDIVDGIKTGYTVQAQQCLVTSAKKNGHRLISVVLKANGKNIYLDSRTLIDYGFENYKFINLSKDGMKVTSIPIKNGTEKYLDIITGTSLCKAIPRDTLLQSIDKTIELKENISAPIKKGQLMGKIILKSNGQYLGKVNLIASKSISAKKGILSTFVYNVFDHLFLYFALPIFILFFIWRCIATYIRLKKRKRLLKKRF